MIYHPFIPNLEERGRIADSQNHLFRSLRSYFELDLTFIIMFILSQTHTPPRPSSSRRTDGAFVHDTHVLHTGEYAHVCENYVQLTIAKRPPFMLGGLTRCLSAVSSSALSPAPPPAPFRHASRRTFSVHVLNRRRARSPVSATGHAAVRSPAPSY